MTYTATPSKTSKSRPTGQYSAAWRNLGSAKEVPDKKLTMESITALVDRGDRELREGWRKIEAEKVTGKAQKSETA